MKIFSVLLVSVIGMLLVIIPGLANSARTANDSAPGVSFQQENGSAAIKLDDGILFILNRPGLHFTLTVKGKEIKPVDDSEHIFFIVDGRALQIQVAGISEFASDAKEKKLSERTILAAHRDWESKFLEGLLNSKLKVQNFNAKLSNGGEALLWQFDMPEAMNSQAKTQLYLTVVREGYVVMLNCEATATSPEDAVRKFLLDTMATLKTSPVAIDVQKLSESIRAGGKP